MSSPQNAFSVQSFTAHQPSNSPASSSSSSSSPHVQHPTPSSYQAPVAGPSSTTSPLGSSANLAPQPPKDRSAEELQIIQQTAVGFAACLAADHAAVLHPDLDTPFTDVADVVNRLLPYHVFQQPDEDLCSLLNSKRSKGKSKARHVHFRQEIEDTRFALHCYKRLKRLEDRLYRTKIKAGTSPCPDGQAYVLAQSILEVERSETATVSSELRSARNELDATQREKRASSTATSAQPTVTTFRPSYYTQATPSQYYRTYSYAYTHPYNTVAQGTSPAFYSTTLAMPQTSSAAASYTPSTAPIPVQLPVTSLSALHALGIVPVPAASVPPPDQPQPAAVLKGSTSNGSMLSLEINVSLLQSTQMSGLAILLNSLMSRGGAGTGQAGAAIATNSEPVAGQSIQNIITPVVVPIAAQKERDGTG